MSKIKEVRMLRTLVKDNQKMAEVDISLSDGTSLSALVAPKGNGEYTIDTLMYRDVNYELDWYENPLHQAYRDAGNELDDHCRLAERGGLSRSELLQFLVADKNLADQLLLLS
ncbi:MAG: hypothetical protein H7X86_11815 [Gorillibacterium sp.]|nr:hypothetical protein [Gorillibacterium sp.]